MASHIVIGGGVNGLSVAWALAERGADVLVLDKGRIGSGASGIAGGIVRNYYRAEAITELVAQSVAMFEEDPEAYGFRQVGYIAAVPERQADDLVAIRAQHERAGYESELVTGADDCREYLSWTWPDWEAPVAALLHERRGGWADALQTVRQLAARARAAGAEIREDTEVVGVEHDESGASAVLTADGERLTCETLVLAPGPWAARLLALVGVELELAYWKAQEGEFTLPGVGLSGRAGGEAPVVHLDQSRPLRSDTDGRVLVDGPWGIYFRMGRTGTGITGGGLPVLLDEPDLDPYGPDNPATRPSRPSGVLRLRPGERPAALPRAGRRLEAERRRRHRGPHARQLPGLRLGARQRVRDRRLRPRLQDAGRGAAGRRGHQRRGRAAARAVPAGALRPRRAARRLRRARIPGPDRARVPTWLSATRVDGSPFC